MPSILPAKCDGQTRTPPDVKHAQRDAQDKCRRVAGQRTRSALSVCNVSMAAILASDSGGSNEMSPS